MNILSKLQNLPEKNKKMILWIAVIAVGLGLFIWWVGNIEKRLESFQKETLLEDLKLPEIEEKIRELDDIPEIKKGKELIELRKELLKGKTPLENLEETLTPSQ